MSGFCEVSFGDASDDAEPVEFCVVKMVTARKAHTCAECRGQIAVGERYKRIVYILHDGEFGEDKLCPPCIETAGEFEYHIVGGSLWQMLYEEWDSGAHVQSCINRLTSALAKEHMRQQWLKWHDARLRQRQVAMAKRQAAADAKAREV